MKHAQGAGSIARPVYPQSKMQPLCYDAPKAYNKGNEYHISIYAKYDAKAASHVPLTYMITYIFYLHIFIHYSSCLSDIFPQVNGT